MRPATGEAGRSGLTSLAKAAERPRNSAVFKMRGFLRMGATVCDRRNVNQPPKLRPQPELGQRFETTAQIDKALGVLIGVD